MVHKNTKNKLLRNIPLKIISFICGYMFWYLLSGAHTVTIWKKVPLCFYAVPSNWTINSPETVEIQLSGKRAQLYTLSHDNLAIHINAQNLQVGKQPITITNNKLFLPDTIKLVNCIPSNLFITVEQNSKKPLKN